MLSSLQSQDSGSSFLDRYAAQMGAMARQRRAEYAVIDTQKRAEGIAERLHQVIEQTAKESDYLVDMSYRLRTLLNAIIGFSSLMENEQQGPLQGAYKEYASDIHESGREVLSLLEEFSEHSGNAPNHPATEPVNGPGEVSAAEPAQEKPVEDLLIPPVRKVTPLNESIFTIQSVIRDAYTEIREPANQKQIKIRARLGRDLPDIRADHGLIKSMLTHLIGVAIDGAVSGAEVEFIASLDDNGAIRFAVDATVHDAQMIAKGLAQQHWEWVTEIMTRHGGRFGLEGDPKRHFLAVATLPGSRTTRAAVDAGAEEATADG